MGKTGPVDHRLRDVSAVVQEAARRSGGGAAVDSEMEVGGRSGPSQRKGEPGECGWWMECLLRRSPPRSRRKAGSLSAGHGFYMSWQTHSMFIAS